MFNLPPEILGLRQSSKEIINSSCGIAIKKFRKWKAIWTVDLTIKLSRGKGSFKINSQSYKLIKKFPSCRRKQVEKLDDSCKKDQLGSIE